MSDVLQERIKKKYDAGFTTNVESETLPPGLNENTIKQISKIKQEPDWL
jgi:Fe-S cluster assembly protein SufB